MTEGQIIRLLVAAGDQVVEDQPLLEVETDKAAVEIPSPVTGTVARIHVNEQQIVNVGDVLITFDGQADGAAGAGGGATADSGPKRSAPPATTTTRTADVTPMPAPNAAPAATVVAHQAGSSALLPSSPSLSSAAVAGAASSGKVKPASPSVRKLARQLGVDLQTVPGTGPRGRVTRRDVEAAGAVASAAAVSAVAVGSPQVASRAVSNSPSLSASLLSESFSESAALPPPPPAPPAADPPGTAGQDNWGKVIRQPLSRIRKTIAETMARSVANIPHVTDTDDADISELDQLRRGYARPDGPGFKLTILPFVIRAVALALGRFPIFNAEYDTEAGEILFKRYISIALGVQTERGLVAPVLRSADRMTIVQLADAANELAHKARTGRFSVDDQRGGTFTISNAGAMGGSRYSTPIINYPQVAILALGRSRWRPTVVQAGEIVPRLILPMSLSFDHRLIDGGASIPFMRDIIGSLQNPARVML